MKLILTLRTCLVFAILVSTVGLISHALAKVSPAPKKVSPAPKKVSPAPPKNSAPICNRTIKVQVVALDQPWMWNRLGASQPGGMIYALARDVERNSAKPGEHLLKEDGELKSIESELPALCGKVRLRDDKRARPLVLRANKGDCLEITFANLLSTEPSLEFSDQVKKKWPLPTRWAGLHATGMELVGDRNSDSSWVGTNENSLAKNGELKTYRWYAVEEGTFLIYSAADMDSQYQANQGLFGAIHVEPEGAEWYRSQITHYDLVQATLRQEDLKFSQKIDALPSPSPSDTVARPTDAQRYLKGFKPKAMENRIADKVSSLPVYVNEEKKDNKLIDSRIFSSTGQPLINYHAIYTDGKQRQPFGRPIPVLQMLQVIPIGKPLYDQPLKKDNPAAYIDDLRTLETGFVPDDLRKIFMDLKPKVELSDGARVVDQYRYSWLI